MSRADRAPSASTLFWLFMLIVIAHTAARAVALGHAPLETLVRLGNDDIMRFLSVQSWLDGQGWYDMVQYRMLPPEGLDLHWSRYVDAAIGLVIGMLALVLPAQTAAGLALVVWPTLLLLLLIGLTGLAGRRAFGSLAGGIAVLSLLFWPAITASYFLPLRVDHHNVQILLTTAMVVALILPGRPGLLGALAGGAGAASLTVGLEMLLTVAAAGLVLVSRAVLLREGAGRQVLTFSLALAAASALLFAGQTAPSDWTVGRCDELSPPYMALTSMAALISGLTVLGAPRLPHPAARFGALAVLTGLGLWALWPQLSPCLSGPYGALPDAAREMISNRIVEARSVQDLARSGHPAAFRYVFPAFATVAMASILCLRRQTRRDTDPNAQKALGILLAFGWLGVAGSLIQIRMILMATPAVPLLTGAVLASLLQGWLAARKAQAQGRLALPLAAAALTLFFPALYDAARPLLPRAQAAVAAVTQTDGCRTPEALASIADLPPALILSSSNLSAALLLTTPHSVLSGPYHRSADAILNGVTAFDGDEATLRSELKRTGAEYLLLCRGALYGDGTSYATQLAGGQTAMGLDPVPGTHPDLILLRVTDGL